jgi:hypothetical protein
MSRASDRRVTHFTTPSSLLRRALLADALLSGATGLLLTLAAGPLSTLLGLSVGLLRGSGVFILPFAALAAWWGRRSRVGRTPVFALAVCNALWAVDSVLVLLLGWLEPTALGEVFVIGQAVIVAVLAELQFIGLRRSTLVEAHAFH